MKAITGNASKPITLYPLKFDKAVSALLKVKPEPKPAKKAANSSHKADKG